jgi:D-alanyl-D-alanine carboxypeptidase/D-alanyl-D-alanine-endopeptidase (penicillin-binding protein 4)
MFRARVASIRLSSPTDLRPFAAAALALAFGACHGTSRPTVVPAPPPVSSARQLQRDIDAILGVPELARSTWGISVRSATSEETLYSRNPDKLLMPGSVLKIVTLAAAAERLGWSRTYETRLLAAGAIDPRRGVLDGDLLVAGTGDPSIVTADGTASRLFSDWVGALQARGVKAITGRIIGDDNAFDDEAFGPGWAWDDLAGRDATAISALQFNENIVLATIVPATAIDRPAHVTLDPPDGNVVVDDQLKTAAAGTLPEISARRPPGSSRVELRGAVPIGGGPFVRAVSVDNPTLFFAASFRNALIAAGIQVGGAAADLDDLLEAPPVNADTVVAIHRSPPLSELARRLMKDSQNLYAETLIKTLGGSSGAPSFANGRVVIAATLAPWGVTPDAIVQVDGSGLSRYNYLTADALATILLHVDRDDDLRVPFESSLPIAGVDGTLTARMTGTRAQANAAAKSGTLANVRSLAGYVETADGERLIFAIIANNFGTRPDLALAAIDGIVVKLAEFRR